jgi:hypothetical protein
VFRGRNNRSNECDKPGKLLRRFKSVSSSSVAGVEIQRTIAIEMVASAKGSPSILSMLMARIPPVRRPLLSICPFILRRDGE